MTRFFLVLTIGLVLTVSAGTSVGAQTQTIFTDDFNDGILDPTWQINFVDDDGITRTTGWDFEEQVAPDSNLIVRDVIGSTPATGWRVVNLHRTFSPLTDFHITMAISWSSEGPNSEPNIEAIHNILLTILDEAGSLIVRRAGFTDSWGNDNGTRVMVSPSCCIVPSSLGETGSAEVELVRTGANLDFIWDGVTVFSSPIGLEPASQIRLSFEHFDSASSHMGTLFMDEIKVEGTPVAPTLSCVGFDPPAHKPISVKKPNRVLPLRMVLLDSNGQIVTDGTIQNPPILEVDLVSPSSSVEPPDELIEAGQGDMGNEFAFTDGQWKFKLKLSNFSGPGLYEASVVSGDTNEYFIAQPTCAATFTIAN